MFGITIIKEKQYGARHLVPKNTNILKRLIRGQLSQFKEAAKQDAAQGLSGTSKIISSHLILFSAGLR